METEELIAEARRLENDYGDNYEVMLHMSELADALEAYEARYESAEHDRLYWRRLFRTMRKRAEQAEAERDAALAAVERVRDLASSLRGRYAENSDAAYFTSQFLAALDGAPEPEWEPCTAEIHSWSKQAFHRNRDIDSYWIRCTLLGKHDEHEDSNTGLTWRSGLPVEGEKP